MSGLVEHWSIQALHGWIDRGRQRYTSTAGSAGKSTYHMLWNLPGTLGPWRFWFGCWAHWSKSVLFNIPLIYIYTYSIYLFIYLFIFDFFIYILPYTRTYYHTNIRMYQCKTIIRFVIIQNNAAGPEENYPWFLRFLKHTRSLHIYAVSKMIKFEHEHDYEHEQ